MQDAIVVISLRAYTEPIPFTHYSRGQDASGPDTVFIRMTSSGIVQICDVGQLSHDTGIKDNEGRSSKERSKPQQ